MTLNHDWGVISASQRSAWREKIRFDTIESKVR